MASDIAAVLLIPHAGDPLGLLREGPCGARPPVVCSVEPDDGWMTWCGGTKWCTRALVLAWDGEPVAEGLDRLCRAANADRFLRWRGLAVAMVHGYAQAASHEGVGTLLLLDSNHREVTP